MTASGDGAERVRELVTRFETGDELLDVEPLGSGHIHDTWVSRVRTPEGVRRFVHQRINQAVFAHPEQVMENIERVLAHQKTKILAAGGDPDRAALTIVPARAGGALVLDADGGAWRTYRYIEGARTHDRPLDGAHVRAAGRAFATFHRQVEDLPGPRLHETIPGFGDTRMRFRDFERTLREDARGRAASAGPEVAFALARRSLAELLVGLQERGEVPERILHYDTKLNNVLIDDETGEGVCVIDLDTVMPGTILYDFGDCARRAVSRTDDDERDLSRVTFDAELFEQLVCGFLDVHRGWLMPVELDHLAEAAHALTFTIGLRFLSDHLAGDVYFRTAREGHNLDRCRTQFALLERMEEDVAKMREIVRRHR